MVTKIKLVRKERERDKVLNKINEMKKDYEELKRIFEDPKQTHVKLALNPDQLSLAESIRILDGLKGINVSLNQLLIIKSRQIQTAPRLNRPLRIFPC